MAISSVKKHPLLIIYLASLAAFAPFSTDIFLASMPIIQKTFHTTTERVQLTLTLFLFGYALAQLLWGPLSDRIGRKPVIFIGLFIYLIGSIISAISTNILMLIIGRIIQAIGACSGIVMSTAIIKDLYAGHDMSKVFSKMMSVAMIAPMIAPIIGSYLLVHFNWQSNFYFLIAYCLLLLVASLYFKESYIKEMRTALPLNKLFSAYRKQISFMPFLLAVLALSCVFATMFAFISTASFIYLDIYKLHVEWFGWYFAINASSLILSNIILKHIHKQISKRKLVIMAISVSLFGEVCMLLALHYFPSTIWSVVVPSFVVTLGVGLGYPQLMSFAINNVLKYAGLASSLAGSAQFIIASIVATIVVYNITNVATPLPLSMLTLSLLSIFFVYIYFAKFSNEPSN
jgi:MFS transporter, DHA1 family, multidrug resistance protein